MSRLKPLLVLFISLMLTGISLVASETYYLNVKMLNGEIHSYALADKPIITFPDSQTMSIMSDDMETGYSLASIVGYDFSTSSMLASTVADSFEVKYLSPDCIEVTGHGSLHVSVYDQNGRTVYATDSAEPQATVSLGNLSKGLYIISINNKKNIKIIKK